MFNNKEVETLTEDLKLSIIDMTEDYISDKNATELEAHIILNALTRATAYFLVTIFPAKNREEALNVFCRGIRGNSLWGKDPKDFDMKTMPSEIEDPSLKPASDQ